MISFGTEEVVQLTQEIWVSMIHLALEPAGARIPTFLPGAQFVGGCVQIAGAWNGAVRIDCSQRLGRRAAAAFLGIAVDEVSRDHVRDAVGELANITAGMIKPLLPRPSHISLPTVVDGQNYEFTIRRGKVVLSSEFECGEGLVAVTIVEGEPPDGDVPESTD